MKKRSRLKPTAGLNQQQYKDLSKFLYKVAELILTGTVIVQLVTPAADLPKVAACGGVAAIFFLLGLFVSGKVTDLPVSLNEEDDD